MRRGCLDGQPFMMHSGAFRRLIYRNVQKKLKYIIKGVNLYGI